MGKIAFVFSGQGDQFPGMGKELYGKYSVAKSVFDGWESARDMCFEGSEEELKETKNTQPCLFAFEMAAAKVLENEKIKPCAVAGFSLGEVVAMSFAGLTDENTGFELVTKRGELMQSAAEKFDTSMAAVVKLSEEKVIELCNEYDNVYPVNFNCPGQISVSGLRKEMEAFAQDVKDAGGRAIPLKVKGAFHSPFMNEAAELFRAELEKIEFKEGNITLYSNVTAQPYTEDTVALLSKQIASPVKWEKIIRNMIEDGIDTFIEIGPGKTLSGMIKKIDSTVKVYSVSDMEAILSEVTVC